MLDPIAEMLARIKNAQRAGKKDVLVKASNLKLAIAKILEKEKFIEFAVKEKTEVFENIRIALKYYQISNTKKIPAIKEIKRVSREGQRIYTSNKDIKVVKNRFGIAIISTSRGVMTGEEAKKSGLGGEYICQVW
jgi:small subunit ribosomal protein S8